TASRETLMCYVSRLSLLLALVTIFGFTCENANAKAYDMSQEANHVQALDSNASMKVASYQLTRFRSSRYKLTTFRRSTVLPNNARYISLRRNPSYHYLTQPASPGLQPANPSGNSGSTPCPRLGANFVLNTNCVR